MARTGTVLVTGASGFVGSAVARRLREAGFAVRALVRLRSPTTHLAELGLDFVTGDLRDPGSLRDALAGVRYLFHVAADYRMWARNPQEMIDTNVAGTRALMQANRRLSAQWLRLQRANGFKNEILGTVAHDLKNPLGVILGRTEMLTELISTNSSKESVTAQVEHIRDATRRLTSMVDHLISDAMADAFDITIRREPVDIAALSSEVAEANQPSATNKQQTITVSAPPNVVTMCDADRIREAIDNLVSNAIKYSPIGGKITVLVSHEQNNTMIRVADEGAGLSPEDLGRLFGRFQRLSAKPTAGESSTGLGLSIVKRIIDMHGGQVTAESAGPGQGSTFTIILPATEMS